MLHPGALSQKRLKKKIFLGIMQLLNWQKKVLWHATDEQELQYIRSKFGEEINISVSF
jgi:phosphosulfolactate synthase (CoM biosynthesis protein A)